MSDKNPKENVESVESEEEGWKSVGDTGGPAPVTKPVEDAEESHVYKGRAAAPPWKMGMYSALAGLLFAILLLVLPEFRRFSLTGATEFETGYFLLVIPVIAILWSLGGLIHKDFAADRGKAVAAIVIALVSSVILVYAIATDPAKDAVVDGQNEQQQRLDMTEEELQEWRENRLNR